MWVYIRYMLYSNMEYVKQKYSKEYLCVFYMYDGIINLYVRDDLSLKRNITTKVLRIKDSYNFHFINMHLLKMPYLS